MKAKPLEKVETANETKQSFPARLLDWVQHVFYWDGLLPTIVVFAPPLIMSRWQKNDGVYAVTCLGIPIIAFAVRVFIGIRYFQTHPRYVWQRVLLNVAIFYLIVVETVFVSVSEIVTELRSDALKDPEILRILGIFYGFYLGPVALAFYPFPGAKTTAHPGDFTLWFGDS